MKASGESYCCHGWYCKLRFVHNPFRRSDCPSEYPFWYECAMVRPASFEICSSFLLSQQSKSHPKKTRTPLVFLMSIRFWYLGCRIRFIMSFIRKKNATPPKPCHNTKPSLHPKRLRILNGSSQQTLWILDVDSLDIRIQAFCCTFLVISLSADSDTKTVWNSLNTSFPDLLVQLWIETDIGGTLNNSCQTKYFTNPILFYPPVCWICRL